MTDLPLILAALFIAALLSIGVVAVGLRQAELHEERQKGATHV